MKKDKKTSKNSELTHRLSTNVDNSLFSWVKERAAAKSLNEAAFLRMMLSDARAAENESSL